MKKRQEALEYHSRGRPGKIAVVPTKPLGNQRDLALAYTPGVAEPCLEIEKTPDDVYKYTAKGNLVGVVTNGTAVLGLGNIGAHMEQDINLVIDVDPNEAGLLIGLIETLIQDWFVGQHERAERMAGVIAASGRKREAKEK